MSAIDLVVLGVVKQQQPVSAYDIQKLVEYRHISKWVKISTPSVYKKVLALEAKGLLTSEPQTAGSLPQKAVYSLTPAGDARFAELMREVAAQPVRLFLDLNAVVVNLGSADAAEQKRLVAQIASSVDDLCAVIDENLSQKRGLPQVPAAGIAVLEQQQSLAQLLKTWVAGLQDCLPLGNPPAPSTPSA